MSGVGAMAAGFYIGFLFGVLLLFMPPRRVPKVALADWPPPRPAPWPPPRARVEVTHPCLTITLTAVLN